MDEIIKIICKISNKVLEFDISPGILECGSTGMFIYQDGGNSYRCNILKLASLISEIGNVSSISFQNSRIKITYNSALFLNSLKNFLDYLENPKDTVKKEDVKIKKRKQTISKKGLYEYIENARINPIVAPRQNNENLGIDLNTVPPQIISSAKRRVSLFRNIPVVDSVLHKNLIIIELLKMQEEGHLGHIAELANNPFIVNGELREEVNRVPVVLDDPINEPVNEEDDLIDF